MTRPLLCELLGSMAGVLERNISAEFARDFKARAMARTSALSGTGGAAPAVAAAASFTEFFAEGALTLTAGMYPFSVPTDPVRVGDGRDRAIPTAATAVRRRHAGRTDHLADWRGGAKPRRDRLRQ